MSESLPPDAQRKIIHIDMDCFYAAVEMRDDPSLKGKPLAVGGASDRRGVISTCNYEAREFGVHSAMATAYALKLCPGLKVVSGRMSHYQDISRQIRAIFERYTDLIEPLSLDEAFLDVSDSKLFQGSATRIAEDIRRAISTELDLTASAGVAPNKFLAKICSDENKPDGICVVRPDQVTAFAAQLAVKKIPGVGKVTVARLEKHGIVTCSDVLALSKEALIVKFGSLGELLLKRAKGIDNRPLTTSWVRKSVSVEHTYAVDIEEIGGALAAVDKLFEELERRLKKHQDRTIKNQQVKLKFTDFKSTTIERSTATLDKSLFLELIPAAWDRGLGKGIRLLGLGVTFRDPVTESEENQLALF